MDAAISIAGISEALGSLLEERDFVGAEELLASALGACRQNPSASVTEAYIHFQFGRLYREWNKLSSSINHLNLAAELAASHAQDFFLIQVVEELKLARNRQHTQKP